MDMADADLWKKIIHPKKQAINPVAVPVLQKERYDIIDPIRGLAKILRIMKAKRTTIFLSAATIFASVLFVSCKTEEHDLVITHVNIIDVKSGRVAEDKTVVIDSNMITAIHDGKIRYSSSTKVIDGSNKYLIPGLWDMHAHFYWNNDDSDPLLIANGITGVREMWGVMPRIRQIREKTQTGEIIAPDVYTAGVVIDGNPPIWPGTIGVATPDEARKAAEDQIAEGVDFIKVYSALNEESFMTIADVARKRNIPFAGHIPSNISIYKAMDAGMASSEHLTGILEACSAKEDSIMKLNFRERIVPLLSTFKQERFDSLCTALAQSKMWLCPTLTVLRAFGFLKDSSFINDARLVYLPDYLKASWSPKNDFRFQNRPEDYFPNQRKKFQLQLSLIKEMSDRGVKFLAGTDYPNPYCFPGFSLHDELALLVEGGMSALDALRAATINGAVFMGKADKMGAVEAGKLASLVLLNKNPLLDIENTKTIEAVILRGKLYDRPALDRMLNQAKINAAKPKYSFWLKGKISSGSVKDALDSLQIMIAGGNNNFRLEEQDLNALGYEYMTSGNLLTAQAIFKKNMELFPESDNVYNSYAASCLKAGQNEGALKYYSKALEINPANAGAKRIVDSLRMIKK
ncbi:MAG TPA: amidohydrolase family protein [Chitinophagaceae bacterium]|nr:amidohydrolase family protein [Chitinophagaceae bacterium]